MWIRYEEHAFVFESLSQTVSAWIRQFSRNPCRTAPWTREVTSSCRGPSQELSRLKCHGCTMVRTKAPTVPASPSRQRRRVHSLCVGFFLCCAQARRPALVSPPSTAGRSRLWWRIPCLRMLGNTPAWQKTAWEGPRAAALWRSEVSRTQIQHINDKHGERISNERGLGVS